MTLPTGAKFEALLAGGVALWDVSALLPHHKSLRYPSRPVEGIERVYVHHSGALGAAGYEGAVGSARYSVKPRKGSPKGWPGAAYHFWIPAETLRDAAGRMVVMRMQSDATRCYHTGDEANDHGIGVVLQGNTTALPLTASHEECLEALLPWLRARHELAGEWLSWHSDSRRFGGSGKATCPGVNAEKWLEAYKGRLA